MARAKDEKDRIETISQSLIQLTGEFCDLHLDDDYKQLAEKLILKMKRKRTVPFLRGRVKTWAAAILYALGQINFLFDRSFEPYVEASVIPEYFGVSQSTAGQKAKVIRDMFDLYYWHPEFSTQQMRASDPYRGKVMINGFIVPIHMLPPEAQEELRNRGII
jgi:hypothetical protein